MKTAFNIDYRASLSTGIGRYGVELIRSWIQLGNSYEVWMPGYLKEASPVSIETQGKTMFYPWPRRITDYFWPSIHSLKAGIRWVHSSNCRMLPVSRSFRQVCMIHDMGPFLYGHMKTKKDTGLWVKRIKNVAENADCIVVNSSSTRNDLLNIFPQVSDRTFLTPLGIDHFSKHNDNAAKPKHILVVGTVEPRKNIDGLLKAYAILQSRTDVPPLVIAGMDGFRAEEYKKLPYDLGIENKVFFTGYVSDSELTKLYSEAFCLVHPAHHEGFGFTVPEAFTWKLPVVASNTGGLGEFFSRAAWMVDPSNPESIASGIENALDSGITPEQQKKREELSAELTWKNCALKTKEAMEAVSN